MSGLDAALGYIAKGWPVFPMSIGKWPLSPHGLKDATTDPTVITTWWTRWPEAVPAIATGAVSGVVVIDIDNKPDADGFLSLEELGVHLSPETAMSHTPSGGLHLLFKHPGGHVKTVASKLAAGIDIRGDGGNVMLPPARGRFWDPICGVDTPLLPLPAWAKLKEPEPRRAPAGNRPGTTLTEEAEVILDDAVREIIRAPRGQQEQTLNGQSYRIGGLVASNSMPSQCALDSLLWAARQMPDHDRNRRWKDADLERKVRDALFAGMAKPWWPRRAA